VFSIDGKAHFYCFEDCQSGTGYTFEEFLEAAERAKPWFTKGTDFDTKFQKMPEQVIQGLAHKGEVLTVVGGSKTRKTYFVYQLILSIAFGLDWLGYKTTPGRVLIIDNELLRPSIRRRLRSVANGLGLDEKQIFDHIDISAQRDNPMDVEELLERVRDIGPGGYSTIVVDSLYKSYPNGVDENSNSGMTRVFRALAQMGQTADALVVVSHHFSKGSQQGRAVADLGSGAGAQSRSTDCHLVLRPHKDKGHLIIDFVVREFAPPEQGFVIRDAFPLWELAPDKNPNDKLVTPERSNLSLDKVVAMLKFPISYTDFAASARSTLGGTKEAVKLVINEAITQKLIQDEPSSGRKPRMLRPVEELPMGRLRTSTRQWSWHKS
jgi:KaiC/GvpD/RAD55 family RecA-like ATPase